MNITLSFDDRGLSERLARMEKDLPRKVDTALYAVAQQGINIILDRTKKGISASGGTFKPYTPKYALFRRENGRQSATPDLNFTGSMLSSMTAFKGRGYSEIKFSRSIESKKAYYNNKRRRFFDFSVSEKRSLLNMFAKRVFK